MVFVLGSNLNEVFGDLVKFDIEENVWELVQPMGDRPVSSDLTLFRSIP